MIIERFEWHPTYRGRSVAQVRGAIREELASDQRRFALSLEGADRDEGAVLQTVVGLEKKWGGFDMDWAEADPDALADRIAAFEVERERRRELFPFRAAAIGPTAAGGDGDLPTSRLPPWVWIVAALIAVALVLSLIVA
jgi:hypothetical protein